MTLSKILQDLLSQFYNLNKQLSNVEFSQPSPLLFGSSIGQHMRHSVEFVGCFLDGIKYKKVCYDKRKHDVSLESDKELMNEFILQLNQKIEHLPANDSSLTLASEYKLSNVSVEVETNIQRELISNIEHIVHHMAIIKVAVNAEYKQVELPSTFGIAQSTIAYQNQEA